MKIIGSEREAINVFDLNCKSFRFVDFPTVWASGSFSAPKMDPRGMTEMYGIVIGKPNDSLIFLPFGRPEPFRSQKSDPRGMPEM